MDSLVHPREFGEPAPGRSYQSRTEACGLAFDARGWVLCAADPETGRLELPGGALAPGEDEDAALYRAWLGIWASPLAGHKQRFARAWEYDGAVRRETSFFFCVPHATFPGPGAARDAVWLPLEEAHARLAPEAHRWAVYEILDFYAPHQ